MIRIWCVSVSALDREHLLGEHVELHTIVNVILRGKGGFFNHPQTNRFKGKLGQLVDRHNQQVGEMEKRGYKHNSPLPKFEYGKEEYSYTNQEMFTDLEVLIKIRESKKGEVNG